MIFFLLLVSLMMAQMAEEGLSQKQGEERPQEELPWQRQ